MVKWEDPPIKGRAKTPMLPIEVQKELKDNPGKWALLKETYSYSAGANWAFRLRREYPDFEFRGARNNNKGLVYGRYTGPS